MMLRGTALFGRIAAGILMRARRRVARRLVFRGIVCDGGRGERRDAPGGPSATNEDQHARSRPKSHRTHKTETRAARRGRPERRRQ